VGDDKKTTLATHFVSSAEAAATEINTLLISPDKGLQINSQLDFIAIIWILMGIPLWNCGGEYR
jgi:hypothetical protein